MKSLMSIILLALISTISACGADQPDPKLNVLFFVTDDLSVSLHSFGKEGIITPNIDKLARQGRIFTRAYCQASLCNPSRASLMTGRYPHELGIWRNESHFRGKFPKIKTLSERFKDQGYHAAGIGKIYHNWAQSLEGDAQSWSYPQVNHWGTHYMDWYVPGRLYEMHTDLRKGPAVQCVDVPDEAYIDGRTANAAINKLRELQEVPFFLAVGFWKPHLPFNPPKKYWDMYDRENLPPLRYEGPVEGVPEISYVNSNEGRSYTDVPKTGPISEDKKQELRHGYYAAISYVDAQIGKVMDELQRLGLSDNTIVVFISDHGYHAGEHGQFGKWTNFEIGTRVPLIIASPGIPQPGIASTSLVELVDLYPTLLDLCGIEIPADDRQPSGVSLSPVLSDPATVVRKSAISQISRPLASAEIYSVLGSSIRTENYRYNVWIQRKDGQVIAEELYDLSTDIQRVENRIEDREMKKIKETLSKELNERTRR
jgi:iduronate 2-sulfatase